MIFAAVALSLAGVPARRILAGPLEFAAPSDLTIRHDRSWRRLRGSLLKIGTPGSSGHRPIKGRNERAMRYKAV
jgi:hypothetical protein